MPRARRSASPIRRPAAERQSYAPPPAASRQPAPVRQQPMAMQAPASQGPGLMGQMAATAGGVAIGSVVGHGVSNALFGGGGQSEAAAAAPPPQQLPAQQQYAPPPQQQQQQQQPQVCGWELQQFLSCAQNQQDISLCEGFNDALKQCKRNNGMMA